MRRRIEIKIFKVDSAVAKGVEHSAVCARKGEGIKCRKSEKIIIEYYVVMRIQEDPVTVSPSTWAELGRI
jgi:hypothetical protein